MCACIFGDIGHKFIASLTISGKRSAPIAKSFTTTWYNSYQKMREYETFRSAREMFKRANAKNLMRAHFDHNTFVCLLGNLCSIIQIETA